MHAVAYIQGDNKICPLCYREGEGVGYSPVYADEWDYDAMLHDLETYKWGADIWCHICDRLLG